MGIAENIAALHERVECALAAAGRESGAARIELAVKTRSPEEIALAARALHSLSLPVLLGQNHAQECVQKNAAVRALLPAPVAAACRFHYIGALQSNKMGQVLRTCSLIETVESTLQVERLERRVAALMVSRETQAQNALPAFRSGATGAAGGAALDEANELGSLARVTEAGEVDEAAEASARFPVYLQLKSTGEPQKGGCAPEAAEELATRIASSAFLELCGIMTLGAAHPAPGQERKAFTLARETRDFLSARIGLPLELSMGMSGDLEAALECGSTLVRVGTAAFGPRSSSPRPAPLMSPVAPPADYAPGSPLSVAP